MNQSIKKTAERLGTIRINNGQSAAELVRERDPAGTTVVHAVRRSNFHVHERLHATGRLVHELYDAAEKFRLDFERAQLSGNYATLDMFKTRAGRSEISNGVALAKVRVNRALDAIGGLRNEPSFSQSCMWNVVGAGMTLDSWTHMIRSGGGAMNADKASGILHSTLERLAFHYGMIDVGRMAAIRQGAAYRRAISDFVDFVDIFSMTAQGSDKAALGKLATAARKRFVVSSND